MRRYVLLMWVALAAGGLAGCTPEVPKFKPVEPIPAGQGVIYLYRPLVPGEDALLGTLTVNRRPITQLKNGGYFPYTAAGPVYFQLITSDPNRTLLSRAAVRVEPGREKYLKISKVGDRLKFTPVMPADARPEIAACLEMDALAPITAPAAAPAYAPSPAARSAVRRPAPVAAPAAPARRQGRFSFEAERIAMENGCTTPSGVRPTAYLVEHGEALDVYDIACASGHMSVGCQFQFCELMQ
jgi:hypothetical protein